MFIIHSDVAGPVTPITIKNQRYFVLFIDEFTHYCVTYLIECKSQVFHIFKDFVAKSEAHFNLKIANMYCDNGGEYLSNEMQDFCVEKGITYHLTVPRTPQLNGVAERMVRTVTERARAMIHGSMLNEAFWGEAVLTATYLINITPTKALKLNKTPFELWHNKKPKIQYLKVFGSTVYVLNKTIKRKFDEKSFKTILVGYEPNGYKVWDVEKEEFIKVRDVIVDESNYLSSRPVMSSRVGSKIDTYSSDKSNLLDVNNSVINNSLKKTGASDESSKPEITHTVLNELDKEKSNVSKPSSIDNSDFNMINDDINNSVVTTNKCDTSTSLNTPSNSQNFSEPRRSERIRQLPIISYDENDIFDYCLLTAQSLNYTIPTTFKDIKSANNKAHWEQAVKDEINSLLINKTWTLVEKPENKNIVDCRWIFTIKFDGFGNPIKYKARVVARGFSQKYLEDYDETFAPVARITRNH